MKVTQLHEIINAVTSEILGDSAVVAEDLSNVVDVGKLIVDSDNVDNYVNKLVNHIGRVIFVNRLYAGGVPSVLMDSWEYGSILEKISADLPDAEENATWDLTDRESYNPNIFYKPSVSAKFFNSKVTFEIPLSFTERQVKESFSSAAQLNGFVSMLTTSVENSMTVKLDALIMRTINNMTAETAFSELATVDEGDESVTWDFTASGVRSVNLLNLYNATVEAGDAVTAADALTNPAFIRYATYIIGLYGARVSRISTLFNVEGKERFTPANETITVLLADFSKASETFLASNTFNDEKVTLPAHDVVPYWQGSGVDYAFDEVSKINVKTSSGNDVEMSGIIGVMFDRDALGVTNLNRRVTTNYNPKAEFYTNFYKFDAGYYNDLSENFVVFFVG